MISNNTKNKINLGDIQGLAALLKKANINTVCVSARCPNKGECFKKGTATFLILGDQCSRNCRFCSVKNSATLLPPDPDEPQRLGLFARELGLRHIVITSVTRDDLADGGAGHFAATIAALRELNPAAVMEVLTPDFKFDRPALDTVLAAGPEVFNHNVETIPRLYAAVRPQADYRRSLQVLAYIKEKNNEVITKSGLMLGLGEERSEVEQVLKDLRAAGCDIVIIGQYFQPTRENIPVSRYLAAAEFKEYETVARNLGFISVAAGPYVRSSYLAGEIYQKLRS
jgi:lipoic acid synthetase